jgi:hypothetical protein
VKTAAQSGRSLADGELQLPVPSLFAIAAVLCFGIGDALKGGRYGTAAIVLMLVGVILVWAASRLELGRLILSERNTRIAVGLAFGTWFFAALRFRGGLFGTGRAETASVVLVIVAATAALVFAIFRLPRQALAASILLVGGACIAMIIASPEPRIDVWEMFQAVAHGLLHGHNVYTQRWSPNIPHQATIYTYFPGSAVVLAPFFALFGDVRFGVTLSLLVSAVLIGRMRRDPQIAIFGALLLLFPYLTFSVEQSWSEPLVLVFLLLMVRAIQSDRHGWAIVALAVVLTFQQYDLILVPLTAAWADFGVKRTMKSVALAATFIAPWALAAPHSFVQGVIVYQVDYAFASHSLSVFHQLSRLSETVAYAVLVGGVGVALIFSMRRVHGGGSFLMACGVVLSTLNVLDKVSFFNEWELAAGVVVAAGAEAYGAVSSGRVYGQGGLGAAGATGEVASLRFWRKWRTLSVERCSSLTWVTDRFAPLQEGSLEEVVLR